MSAPNLNVVGKNRHLIDHDENEIKSEAISKQLSAMNDAVEDFQMAMDRCIKAEKVYLEKVGQ